MNEANEYNNEYYEGLQSYNRGSIDSESLKIRLVTRDMLNQCKVFLEGKRFIEYIEEERDAEGKIVNQNIRLKELSIGKPKANSEGIQFLMSWLETKFNAHMALGNISEDQYALYLEDCHANLATNLIINKHEYGMSSTQIREIISVLMESLEIFMSRAIRGGERNSLTQTVKTVDSRVSTPMQRKKVFGIF
jgi:hypothetical protein